MNGILLNHFPKWYYFIPKSPNNQVLVRFNPHIDREQPKKLSEILPPLLGCHQELLLENTRRRWPCSLETELEMTDDSHLASTYRTDQWIHLVDLADHLGPAFGGQKGRVIFNDRRRGDCRNSFSYLPPMSIGVKTIVTDHDLSLIGNMGTCICRPSLPRSWSAP